MDVLKLLNLALRFLLELCLLAAVGYWGFKTQSGLLMKILFGIGLPVLIAVLWGTFLAPGQSAPCAACRFLPWNWSYLRPAPSPCLPAANRRWDGFI